MGVAVVTGSTRGIGRGLAKALLERGWSVVLNGRSQAAVDEAVQALGPDRVAGHAADITDADALQGLWDAAVAAFGRVDLWINNAGRAHDQHPLVDLDPATLRSVVETNVLGTLLGCRTAIAGMTAQGGGRLAIMEGLGSDHRTVVPGLLAYGASKSAVGYLGRALTRELRGGLVQLAILSPGMVTTDLLLEPYRDRPEDLQKAKRIFNILADHADTVTPWLVDRLLAEPRHGARIAWLTGPKIAWRFATAPLRGRDLFAN